MDSQHIDVTKIEMAKVCFFIVRRDIPSNLLHTDDIIEGFYIEISIRKKKWLLVCSYNLHKRFISLHLKELGKNLDFNSK